MTFDTKGFKGLIQELAEKSYRIFEGKKSLRNDDALVMVHWRPNSDVPAYIYSSYMMTYPAKSAHAQLAETKFKTDCKATAKILRDFIAAQIPALDIPGLHLSIEVRRASATGHPRIKFEIMGHPVTSGPVTLQTIVKKVEALAHNLDGVEKPETRSFLINERTYKAQNAYDAVRIYAALKMPEIFLKAPDVTPRISVSEVLDVEPLFAPIFHAAE